MPSVLFIGLSSHDPGFPLPPNADVAALDAKVNGAVTEMEKLGYNVTLFLPPIKEGIELLKLELMNGYDVLLVGIGLRTITALTEYFEEIIHTSIAVAPNTKLAFSKSLDETAAAAVRVAPIPS